MPRTDNRDSQPIQRMHRASSIKYHWRIRDIQQSPRVGFVAQDQYFDSLFFTQTNLALGIALLRSQLQRQQIKEAQASLNSWLSWTQTVSQISRDRSNRSASKRCGASPGMRANNARKKDSISDWIRGW